MFAILFCLSWAFAGGDVFPAPNVTPAPTVSFEGLPESASVRPNDIKGQPHQVHARLLSDRNTVLAGQTFRIGVHLQQDEGWHTYWKSPGSVGQPTDITWKAPSGTQIGEYQYPVPSYFVQSNIVSIGYEEQVLLISEITLPEDAPTGVVTISADVRWLVCNQSCIPGKASLALPINVAAVQQPSPYVELFDHYESLHPTNPLDVTAFTVQTALSASGVKPEETFQFVLQIDPADGKQLQVEQKQGTWPAFTPITGDFWMINDTKVSTTENGGLTILIDAESFEADPLPTTDKIGGLLQLKVDDQWIQTEVQVGLPLVTKETQTIANTSPLLTQNATPAEAAPSTPNVSPAADQLGILQALILAFLGGGLLNIMPCVLPVLVMKLFGLINQSDITAAQQRTAGVAYTGGIVASFLALALIVVILQQSFNLQVGWGFQFQYPAYVITLATIVFVFALSLLGVFEVPAFGANKASEVSDKEGALGYFLTGVFATLLATPCSAPFLGTGIGFAFTLPSWGIFLFFAMAGLGLAFPFLLIAFVPRFFKLLPQPGAWMETFKQFMGFTLIATTIWLIDVLGAQTGMEGTIGFLIFLGVVSFGCWIFGHWGGLMATGAQQLRAFLIAVAISTVAGFYTLKTDFAEAEVKQTGLTDTTDLDFGTEIPWLPFSDDAVRSLKGEAIFIDFTADWCLTCKVNEQTILETEAVRSAMKSNGIIPLKADWTRRDEDITRWLKKYGKAGVPFYLVLTKDGEAIPLPEVITPGMVIEALQKAAS